MENLFYLIPLVILLIIGALTSAAETALMRVNRVRIRHMAEEGNNSARRLSDILKEPDRLLSTLLLLNNFVNILSSAVATAVLVAMFGSEGILYATAIMTFMVLVFGEITPKIIAAYRADDLGLLIATPMKWLIISLRPLVYLLNFISMGIAKLFGVNPDPHGQNITEEDIGSAIYVGHKEGVITEPKAKMLMNVIDLDTVPVRKALIPLSDVVSFPVNTSLDDIIRIVTAEEYARYPVYEGTADNIIGYFHTRDAWRFFKNKDAFSLRNCLREAHFVPETKSTSSQLIDFQKTRSHLAFVVDEFGTIKGIITLEDIIEEITGDISDEHDQPVEGIMPVGQHTYIVNGSTPLRDLERIIDRDFPEDVDTVAGLVYSQLDRIPKEGEFIEWQNLRLGIERMRRNRILYVRITVG
jgi:putative hemolysin